MELTQEKPNDQSGIERSRRQCRPHPSRGAPQARHRPALGRRQKPLQPTARGEDVMHGDLRDPAVVDRLLNGVDVLVHMAGTSVERPLPEIIQNNLSACTRSTRARGATVCGGSSLPARTMPSACTRDDKLKLDAEFRPDGFYGLSKVWGEAMARMYWDKHGIEGISLRIGTTMGRPPENERQLSTWMGTEDLVQLVDALASRPRTSAMPRCGASRPTPAPITTWPKAMPSATSRRRTPRNGPPRSSSSPIRSTPSPAALPGRAVRDDRLHASGPALVTFQDEIGLESVRRAFQTG